MNLFGPLLPIELVRIVHKQRLTSLRCAYAAGIAAFVAAVYIFATENWTINTGPRRLAPITETLFYVVLGIQFLVAAGVATNWTAGAIAREKERRTLSFLLATPLTDREIILGKLGARLAQISMFLLAGLPVICALQFFGGIEPLVVLLGYAATGATVLSLGSLSMLCSVYSRTTRAAGKRTARIIALYIFSMWGLGPLLSYLSAPTIVQDALASVNAGNPIAAGRVIADAARGAGSFDDIIWPAVRDYMAFHLLVTAVCVTWAVRKLRSVAAIHADGPPAPKRTGWLRPPPRPPVSNRPVLWKALYFDFRQFRSVGGRALARGLFAFSFTPVVVMLVTTAVSGGWRTIPDLMNATFVRGFGTIVLCGLLVMIAANSSGSFTVERRKRTFDELVLTALPAEDILGQKWWASIVVVRWALVWVGVHWLIAVAIGALQPLAVPLLMLEWSAYAAFAASLGIYCAARWPSPRKASVKAGLFGFLAMTVPLFIAGAIALLVDKFNGDPSWFLLPASASPPVTLALTGFRAKELSLMSRKYSFELIDIIAGGTAAVFISMFWAWSLWRRARHWFPRTAGNCD